MDLLTRLEDLKRFENEQQTRLNKLSGNDRCGSGILIDLTDERSDDCAGAFVKKPDVNDCNDVVAAKKLPQKRPFLKKGQGLARFRMKPPDLHIKNRVTPFKPCSDQPSCEKQQNPHLPKSSPCLDDLKVFEFLEQRVANTSFCSNSSSIDNLFNGNTHTENVSASESVFQRRPYRYFSPKKRVTFDRKFHFDDKENNGHLKTLDEEVNDTFETTSENMVDDSESVVYVQDAEVQCGEFRNFTNAETMTDDFLHKGSNDSTPTSLSAKMDELDREIRILQQENGRVAQLKSSLEIEKKNFQRERDKLKKTQNQEIESLKIEIESDKSQFAKQKYSLESKIKNFKQQIDVLKKQQCDVEELDNQVKDLKKELKLRDSKAGIVQARLRNQIGTLEKQNDDFKSEIDRLKQLNEKLRVQLKANRKLQNHSNDSKLLHEVNDMLSHFMQLNFNQKPLEEDINTPQEDLPKLDESERIDRRETLLEDGSIERIYSNGNVKIISPDKKLIKMMYYNKDIKENYMDTGVVRYFYNETKIWHTSHPDGTDIFEYNTGEVETRKPNGAIEILYNNGTLKTVDKDKNETINLPDGSKVSISFTGDKTLYLSSGQKEVHTKDYKRREWPDGTVKILYKDGTQETIYSNGRVRIRDGNGDLIMDSND